MKKSKMWVKMFYFEKLGQKMKVEVKNGNNKIKMEKNSLHLNKSSQMLV